MSEQILTKVKDLLALSSGNSNLNESASAYKAAQRLLTRHKLNMADVYASAERVVREPIIKCNEPLYAGKRMITWKGSLAKGICDANSCGCYWNNIYTESVWLQHLVLVGRQSDIDTVRYLYTIISAQIEAMCVVAMFQNGGGGKTFSNNFKLGTVNTVAKRLNEAVQEIVDEYVNTKAMTIINKDKEDLSGAMSALNLRKRTVNSRYSESGYDAGKKAGRRVNLTRGSLHEKIKKPKGILG
ncbi:hypothetical protein LCGC14_0941700 [marine sediment metagenome]|uniref:Uncharacterized protein n=1 Tax=marine sediment metagenome TaxID=412755 RepID=A0A0F9NPJ2_9ZZZZ